jgi:hypothetical protein
MAPGAPAADPRGPAKISGDLRGLEVDTGPRSTRQKPRPVLVGALPQGRLSLKNFLKISSSLRGSEIVLGSDVRKWKFA